MRGFSVLGFMLFAVNFAQVDSTVIGTPTSTRRRGVLPTLQQIAHPQHERASLLQSCCTSVSSSSRFSHRMESEPQGPHGSINSPEL